MSVRPSVKIEGGGGGRGGMGQSQKGFSNFSSSAVPSGNGAFQIPTRPSLAASTLGGEGSISETLL